MSNLRAPAAGGEAAETASPARRSAKKHRKGLQRKTDNVSHRPTERDACLVSDQPVSNSMDWTGCLADNHQQPKLGKRKIGEEGASRRTQERPNSGSGAQPMPAPEASQQEGANKRSRARKSRGQGLAQEVGHSRKTETQDGAVLPSGAGATEAAAAPQQGQTGAGRAKHTQQDEQQSLQINLAQDSAPPAQAPEPVRRKRSRNKFKQDTAAVHPDLPRSVGSAPGAQMPDTVNTKRNRNKFKQANAGGQPALPRSLVPEVTVQQSSPDQAAPNLNSAKQQDALAQQPIKPVPLILQHDKQAAQRSGKQMKGNTTGQESRAARLALDSRDAGKVKDGDATAGHQIARAGASGRKEDGLLSKMRTKLAGSQFRWLNEQLYTCPGTQAFELMQDQPQLFTQYHEVQSLNTYPALTLLGSRLLERAYRKLSMASGCDCALLKEVHSCRESSGMICPCCKHPLPLAGLQAADSQVALAANTGGGCIPDQARPQGSSGGLWVRGC